jgi:DNA-binding transcriptional regulator YdaS (Cro superfamily)
LTADFASGKVSIMDGRKKLITYIQANTTQAAFACAVGCSEPHLSLVLKGERGVSWPLAKRISKATDGAVTVHALMEMSRQPEAVA